MTTRIVRGAAGVILMTFTVATQAAEIVVSVPGIPGPYCAYGVEKRLLEVDGVKTVAVRWQDEQIRAELERGNTVTESKIRQAMENADYPYDYSITIKK